MAHELSTNSVTGKSSMAYVGAKPWHGLGQELTADASFDVWAVEAGLDFQVHRSPVEYATSAGRSIHTSREVLYRDDDFSALGIVSNGYKIVQPAEVLHFFKDLADKGGFQLETAGALQGGQKVWAMAKVGEGFSPIGKDVVLPYVLMTTSFDGSTATTCKFTAIRVVCNNTLTVALRGASDGNVVRVSHNSMFDAVSAKLELGLIDDGWFEYQTVAKQMAEAPMSVRQADTILTEIFAKAGATEQDARESVGYKTVLDLFFNEKSIGADLTEGRTVWAFTNAVTEYFDHHVGRLQDNRVRGAWYGAGNAAKMKAWSKAAELVTR